MPSNPGAPCSALATVAADANEESDDAATDDDEGIVANNVDAANIELLKPPTPVLEKHSVGGLGADIVCNISADEGRGDDIGNTDDGPTTDECGTTVTVDAFREARRAFMMPSSEY